MGFFLSTNVDHVTSVQRIIIIIVSVILLGFMGSGIGAEAQSMSLLPDAEVETLKAVFRKMQLRDMNVTRTSCNDGAFQQVGNMGSQNNITCNCSYNGSTLCHVTTMTLKSLDMAGELPSELQNLKYLVELDLTRNYLGGSIPSNLSHLPLTKLTLIGNRLSERIPPEIGDIATLQVLELDTNNLGGHLPQSLGKLSRLNKLTLSANNFTGTIPETFGDLKSLTDFRINGNTLSGRIPEFIGNWKQMERLDLQGTSMEGPIPSAISMLKSLTHLRISDLTGPSSSFPDLKDMKKMRFLILRNCLINSTIPKDYIGDMTVLDTLDLSFNHLSGEVPQSFEKLEKLRYMFLTNNSLSGVVPDWILSSKRNFDLSYNNFIGSPSYPCPQSQINLVSSYSSIERNRLVHDNQNLFRRCFLEYMTGYQTGSNAWCLKKDLPCEGKARYHSLFINCGGEAVKVDGNEYNEDMISEGASNFASTATWAYSSTGVYVGNDSSQFIARSPSTMNTTLPELYRTARLAPQSLKYYGLCMRPGSYRVVLHFAEITFSNDQTFRSLGRRIFDVAIQGKVLLEDFNIMKHARGAGIEITQPFDVDVNGSTLEIHLYWKGKGTTNIPTSGFHGPLISAITVTPNFKVDTGGGLSTGAIAGIVVSSCLVIALLLAALRMKVYIGRRDLENDELRGLDLQTGYFTLRQIKTATSNFDRANKIGEGGFGPVYKGVLSDGGVIAVKQLSSKSKQGNREFVNEIGMISALQHPNLVKLYGCCIEGNQLLLVYEYLENNSLARALFGPDEHRLNLDWYTRKKICLGIARGLVYLHEESRLKIVHRDIKATNVLLDRFLNAKISDFGLAKLDEEENTHISTRIAGTVGYMAPEYAMRGYLTDKADVYSFGVVMLEIVSGKSNTSYRPREEFVYLLDWAYVLQEEGNLLELVDPALGSQYKTGEALTLLNLALLCTNQSPTLRPSMSSVVSMIEGKTAVQAPMINRNSSKQDPRFKAFERLAMDKQQHISGSSFSDRSVDQRSMSSDGPWVDSTKSIHEASNEHSSPDRLLQDQEP